MDEGPAHIVVADKPDVEADARLLGKPRAAVVAESGTPMTMSAPGAGVPLRADAESAADLVDVLAENEA